MSNHLILLVLARMPCFSFVIVNDYVNHSLSIMPSTLLVTPLVLALLNQLSLAIPLMGCLTSLMLLFKQHIGLLGIWVWMITSLLGQLVRLMPNIDDDSPVQISQNMSLLSYAKQSRLSASTGVAPTSCPPSHWGHAISAPRSSSPMAGAGSSSFFP